MEILQTNVTVYELTVLNIEVSPSIQKPIVRFMSHFVLSSARKQISYVPVCHWYFSQLLLALTAAPLPALSISG